jgi:hypothetical protein
MFIQLGQLVGLVVVFLSVDTARFKVFSSLQTQFVFTNKSMQRPNHHVRITQETP